MTNTLQALHALYRIPITQIVPGPNARGDLGDITDLALSIRTLGLQKPILVTPLDDDRFQVLDGHRRLAAAQHLRLPHLDAIVRRPTDHALRVEQQLAMHAHAKPFDPIAEARALHSLMFDHNLTREDIARAVGKSPAWVRDRIGLLLLDDDEQQSVAAGRMRVGHALLIAQARRVQRDGRSTAADRQLAPARTARSAGQHCRTCTCQERR